jgi:hypothetical protein
MTFLLITFVSKFIKMYGYIIVEKVNKYKGVGLVDLQLRRY